MCNCGNKRSAWASSISESRANKTDITEAGQPMWLDIPFMYTGQSGLTVTGNVTGKKYRFSAYGDRHMIDYRDVSGMRSVEVLRRV